MTGYTFTLPNPPSTNSLYANVPGKGRVKSERYRVWRQAAGWAMRLDGNKSRTWETLRGPVAVSIRCGGKADADNRAKALLDLLVDMAVIADDSQVLELYIARDIGAKQTVVAVVPIPDVKSAA